MVLYTLHNNGYINIFETDYKGKSMYVNMTNKCPCSCTFCLRQTKVMLESNTLWLKKEPTVQEVIDELKQLDLPLLREIVFCGFGEPTERIDDIIEVAKYIKEVCPSMKIRMNTNGLGNQVNNKDITPLYEGLFDTVSISLNASNKDEFLRLTRSKFGIDSFDYMLEFASKMKQYVPHVVLTVVDIIGEEEINKCQAICDGIGVTLRVRPFEE